MVHERGQFAGLADQVAGRARGALAAQRVLALIRSGEADDGALHAALRGLLERAEPHALAGFAHQLQKSLTEMLR